MTWDWTIFICKSSHSCISKTAVMRTTREFQSNLRKFKIKLFKSFRTDHRMKPKRLWNLQRWMISLDLIWTTSITLWITWPNNSPLTSNYNNSPRSSTSTSSQTKKFTHCATKTIVRVRRGSPTNLRTHKASHKNSWTLFYFSRLLYPSSIASLILCKIDQSLTKMTIWCPNNTEIKIWGKM